MLTVAILLASLCQTPAVPLSPVITFPDLVQPVTPKPVPSGQIPVLDADVIYVLQSTANCIVLSSPPGLVTITPEAGPLRIKGRFIDDPGKTKSQTFKGPFLWTIEPVKAGECEILVYPMGGVKVESDVKRRMINVLGAKPPPDPIIPDPPKPDALTGLAKSAFDWASSCTSPTRAKDAAALAKNFRTVASAQAAGVYVNVASMSNELRVLNQTALETDDLWRTAFFVPLNAELTKSVKTLSEYGAACKEVAKGLEAIR